MKSGSTCRGPAAHLHRRAWARTDIVDRVRAALALSTRGALAAGVALLVAAPSYSQSNQPPTAALQRFVDALESAGLRYGLALETRPTVPMEAYAVEPVRVDVPAKEVAPQFTT